MRDRILRLLEPPGDQAVLMLGAEAVVRGALEAGVRVATGYPGTPASEIGDRLNALAEQAGISAEYSINEKVALEVAFGASLAGVRALTSMKHLGLLYAGDPLSTIPYVGTVGGLVIASAGDPGCCTSPNEQDQRLLAPMLFYPTLDPACPQEALNFTRLAFELSEACNLPVLLRLTTPVCHTGAQVRRGPLPTEMGTQPTLPRDPARFVPIPPNARRMRLEIEGRLQSALQFIDDAGLNRETGRGRRGVITGGYAASLTRAVLMDRQEDVRVMTLGAVYPWPEQTVRQFLDEVDDVLVLEELMPYIENALLVTARECGFKGPIVGKRTGDLPVPFAYDREIVGGALDRFLATSKPTSVAVVAQTPAESATPDDLIAPRPAVLCAACPHRASFVAARMVFGEDAVYCNDIGCYTLGYGPPLETADTLLCMGSSITQATGITRATGKTAVAFIGDSTFLHSGMPALLNAVTHGQPLVLVILDNSVTAMTGMQPSTGSRQEHSPAVDIEAIVLALGVPSVETADPTDLDATLAALKRARNSEGVRVVVARSPCMQDSHRRCDAGPIAAYTIDEARCRSCAREPQNRRCDVSTSTGFSRELVAARIGEPRQKWPTTSALAPCSLACPLDICVQGYAGALAAGRPQDALDIIMEGTPLPAVCSTVCHRPCEDACIAHEEPVRIMELKHQAVLAARSNGGMATRGPDMVPDVDPAAPQVTVVGAGPAGLTAANDLARAGLRVKLLDRHKKPGGLLTHGIPPYRLDRAEFEADVTAIFDLGVEFVGGCSLGETLNIGDILGNGSSAVLLAVGASQSTTLNIPGISTGGVHPALEFLESVLGDECPSMPDALCVLGGGSAAMDVARSALRAGASKVTVVCPEQEKDMPADPLEVADALEEGVRILHGQTILEARSRNGCVSEVVVGPARVIAGADGRCTVETIAGDPTTIVAGALVLAVGQKLDPGFAGGTDALDISDDLVSVDENTGRTGMEGVFAAGDAVAGERHVISAMASGRKAARGVITWLEGRTSWTARQPTPAPLESPALHEALPDSESGNSSDLTRRSDGVAATGVSLSAASAVKEARRCLHCGSCGLCRACIDITGCPAIVMRDGRPFIVAEHCSGCGLCALVCPAGAIVQEMAV